MRNTILAVLLLLSTTLFSQNLFERATIEDDSNNHKMLIDFGGYGRSLAYLGFDKYNFATVFAEASFTGKLKYNNTFLFSDLRVKDGYAFNESTTSIQLKELYGGYAGEKIDVLLGNQIVTWGRTDGFNPTNCITPNDYFFLTGNIDDQKLANFMLRIKYRFTRQIELDFISIPVFKPSVYRYELFDFGKNVSFSTMVLPDKTFENASVALRLNFEFPKAGFSISWFRGYNPNYGFGIKNIDWSTETPIITNVATPYLKKMIGADFSIPVLSWVLRGEMAYNITENFKNKMYIPNPDLSFVFGLERNILGFNTIVQYIGKYTFNFIELNKPVLTDVTNLLAQLKYASSLIYNESEMFNRKQFYQQQKTNHALEIILNKPFAYNTWNIEFTTFYNFTSEEFMLRPKISWNISDALTASAGCLFLAGPGKEIFDYAGPVFNGGFFELKVSF